eukprot:jgi/Bigna1/86093/estExt_fgenesh1_pg.C_80066
MQKDGHYCACRVWIVGVAIAIAILQQAWSQHYGKFPVVDPVLEEARLSECKPENYTSLEFLLDNGFILYKGFVSEKERQVMLNFVSSIPLPTRYLCGASDTQPHECMLWEEKMMEMWPKTLHKLYQNFRIWRKKGIMRKLKLDRWGKMRAKGSEFIAINGWPWPWSLFKGQWEFVMGTTMFGIPRAISQFKSFLTQSLNLPIHSGFHDWHTDGPSPDGGRYHKMFIMVDKDTRNGTMRGHTNLMLIPRKNFYKFQRRMDVNAMTMGPLRSRLYSHVGTIHRYHGLDQLACTIAMDPGDALFFMEDVWHRTQDMKTDRFSLIMDIQ